MTGCNLNLYPQNESSGYATDIDVTLDSGAVSQLLDNVLSQLRHCVAGSCAESIVMG